MLHTSLLMDMKLEQRIKLCYSPDVVLMKIALVGFRLKEAMAVCQS